MWRARGCCDVGSCFPGSLKSLAAAFVPLFLLGLLLSAVVVSLVYFFTAAILALTVSLSVFCTLCPLRTPLLCVNRLDRAGLVWLPSEQGPLDVVGVRVWRLALNERHDRSVAVTLISLRHHHHRVEWSMGTPKSSWPWDCHSDRTSLTEQWTA